jgi:hypothetical protein
MGGEGDPPIFARVTRTAIDSAIAKARKEGAQVELRDAQEPGLRFPGGRANRGMVKGIRAANVLGAGYGGPLRNGRPARMASSSLTTALQGNPVYRFMT